MENPELYKEFFDILANRKFVFWTCPNGCKGRVEWNKEGTIAKCKECGLTNKNN